MKCWHFNTELIWGGDHDIEDEDETMEAQFSSGHDQSSGANPQCQL